MYTFQNTHIIMLTVAHDARLTKEPQMKVFKVLCMNENDMVWSVWLVLSADGCETDEVSHSTSKKASMKEAAALAKFHGVELVVC